MEIPSQGPTWNSHWDGITSALIPLMLILRIGMHGMGFDEIAGEKLCRSLHKVIRGALYLRT